MTDKNPYEDLSTETLTEDFGPAMDKLKVLLLSHKLILSAPTGVFTLEEIKGAYGKLVEYLELILVASKMAQEATLLTRDLSDIDPNN